MTNLIALINANPGEIGIITIGPMTTLALAALLDPSIVHKVKSVVAMGGTYLGKGNLGPQRPTVEYNFGFDPEAA